VFSGLRRLLGSSADNTLQWRMRAAVETGHEVLWEISPVGEFRFASPAAVALFGYTADELPGENLRLLLHPHEYERMQKVLRDSTLTASGWRDERFRCVTKDGTERWVQTSAVACLDSRQRVVGFTGTSRLWLESAEQMHNRRNEIQDSVLRMLANHAMRTVFQPIISLDSGKLLGAEALTRFDSEDAQPPDVWFRNAAEVGMSADLEIAALCRALDNSPVLPDQIYVAVNTSPRAAVTVDFAEALTRCPIAPERLVIEVTEHEEIHDYVPIRKALRDLRDAGVRVAVDDAGAGYSSFRHIVQLEPDIIKLDRTIIEGIHMDPARRALAAAVVMFGLEMDAVIVAEGIESEAELRTAQDLGIDAAQGFLIGRPTADVPRWSEWARTGATALVGRG
jgi:PAS domain S-box-containing protein